MHERIKAVAVIMICNYPQCQMELGVIWNILNNATKMPVFYKKSKVHLTRLLSTFIHRIL